MVRSARAEDSARIAELSGMLGRSDDPAEVSDSVSRLLADPAEVVLVLPDSTGHLLGWVHAGEREVLGSRRRCEIIGLIVDPAFRGLGVGRQLVCAVHDWARERSLQDVVVRSNVRRDGAHEFYPAMGYAHYKSQHVYEWVAPERGAP